MPRATATAARSIACSPRCTSELHTHGAAPAGRPARPHARRHRAGPRGLPQADRPRATPQFDDRAHFFAYAASAMRSVVVDYARQRLAQKRGGDLHRVTDLPEDVDGGLRLDEDMLGLDTALNRLADVDPRLAQVVETALFRRPVRTGDRRLLQALRAQRAPRLAEGAHVPAGRRCRTAEARRSPPMDAERWQRLSPLLDALLELTARRARARLARSLRAEDPALADELRGTAGAGRRATTTSCAEPLVDAAVRRRSAGARDRPVPAGTPARRRRHGPGLAGRARRRPVPAPGRAEAAAPGPGRSRPAPALHPRARRSSRASAIRTSRACSTPASAATASPTWRWNTSRANRSPTTARSHGLSTSHARLQPVPAGLRRGQPRARQPDRASRPEAVEHPGHAGRRGAPARLRHRQAARRPDRRAEQHPHRRARLHPALRRARADPRRAGHHHDRRVFARRGAVRTADRHASPTGSSAQTDAEWEEAILGGDPLRPSQVAARDWRARPASAATPRRAGARAGRRPRQHRAQGAGQAPGAALSSRSRRWRRTCAATCDGQPVQARPQSLGYRSRKYLQPASLGARRRDRRCTRVLSTALGDRSLAGAARRCSEAGRAQAMQDFVVGLFENAGDVGSERAARRARAARRRHRRAASASLAPATAGARRTARRDRAAAAGPGRLPRGHCACSTSRQVLLANLRRTRRSSLRLEAATLRGRACAQLGDAGRLHRGDAPAGRRGPARAGAPARAGRRVLFATGPLPRRSSAQGTLARPTCSALAGAAPRARATTPAWPKTCSTSPSCTPTTARRTMALRDPARRAGAAARKRAATAIRW